MSKRRNAQVTASLTKSGKLAIWESGGGKRDGNCDAVIVVRSDGSKPVAAFIGCQKQWSQALICVNPGDWVLTAQKSMFFPKIVIYRIIDIGVYDEEGLEIPAKYREQNVRILKAHNKNLPKKVGLIFMENINTLYDGKRNAYTPIILFPAIEILKKKATDLKLDRVYHAVKKDAAKKEQPPSAPS